MNPTAMIAAAQHVNEEYGYEGYVMTFRPDVSGKRGFVFEVRASDGGEFFVVSDRWGNVASGQEMFLAADQLCVIQNRTNV